MFRYLEYNAKQSTHLQSWNGNEYSFLMVVFPIT